MAEAISKNAARLAIHLLSVFFEREKIACGNCTPAPNRELLDQRVIRGIRRECGDYYIKILPSHIYMHSALETHLPSGNN